MTKIFGTDIGGARVARLLEDRWSKAFAKYPIESTRSGTEALLGARINRGSGRRGMNPAHGRIAVLVLFIVRAFSHKIMITQPTTRRWLQLFRKRYQQRRRCQQ